MNWLVPAIVISGVVVVVSFLAIKPRGYYTSATAD